MNNKKVWHNPTDTIYTDDPDNFYLFLSHKKEKRSFLYFYCSISDLFHFVCLWRNVAKCGAYLRRWISSLVPMAPFPISLTSQKQVILSK